ncbi:MAG: FtsL-like putative cell division protein [Paludibacteraceae bacterium]
MNIRDIQGWLNGEKFRSEKVRKQYKLFGLIAVLIFVYILLGYHSVRQQHQLTDVKKEMLDAKYEYLTISAQFVNTTRPSHIADTLAARGSVLRENTIPPIRIMD